MPKPDLSPSYEYEWRNWHLTQGVGGRVQTFFTPRNRWEDGTAPRKKFQAGIAGLNAIVALAEANRKRVRAVGSGWSLNGVAFTDEYLVNTARLNDWFIGISDPAMVVPDARPRMGGLVFAQCGVQIKVLNAYLQEKRLSLPTSGASNGQTIAGALSTGTHGSANQIGAIQDFMLGIHLVGDGGEHRFIQRKSNRVVTKQFADWLGATLVNDDDLFNAAIVSFGSFGLVHGVLFEAEPLYVLERHVFQRDLSEVLGPIGTLDVTSLKLPKGPELPFHFEVVVNPYRVRKGEKGCFVRFMYRTELGPDDPVPSPQPPPGGIQCSEDLVSIVGAVSDAVPDLIPGLLQAELVSALAPNEGKGPRIGTHGQIFGDTLPTNGGASMELGVPLKRVGDAVALILDSCKENPFGAPLALRFVKSSKATLAFTCFDDITCTMEMPGVDSSRTRGAFDSLQQRFSASDVPHSYHWGQALPLEPEWVKQAFGPRRQAWLDARKELLGPPGRAAFTNALLSRCGLAE